MSLVQKKVRTYKEEYINFGFIKNPQDPQKPLCLQCGAVFSNEAMKPSRLIEHLKRKHPNAIGKKTDFFLELKKNYENKGTLTSIFTKNVSQNLSGLFYSYKVAEIIAKTGYLIYFVGNAHSIAESVIRPCLDSFIREILQKDPSGIMKTIPLSNDTMRRRIDEMSDDIEQSLILSLRERKFSVQLDESVVVDNQSILMAYVRYFDDDCILQEELLFVKSLITDTTGLSIFKIFESYLSLNNIPFENILSCATDGAMAMVGKYRGFLAFLKQKCPMVISIHCILHRHHLIAKKLSEQLNGSMQLVIKIINKIKRNSKYDRIFREYCIDQGEDYVRLLLHTEVRWLSKGNCLERFVKLFDSIVDFFKLQEEFEFFNSCKIHRKNIFYLNWIFKKLNEVSLALQGDYINLIDCKRIINTFIEKIEFFRVNLVKRKFGNLDFYDHTFNDNDLKIYEFHLESLAQDLKNRFSDIINLNFSDWMINPWVPVPYDSDEKFQEELIELKNDEELKVKFKNENLSQFWGSKTIKIKFPKLWEKMKPIILCFPTSFCVERGFSTLNNIIGKKRNKISIEERGDIRMALTRRKANIENLVNIHQPQGSH